MGITFTTDQLAALGPDLIAAHDTNATQLTGIRKLLRAMLEADEHRVGVYNQTCIASMDRIKLDTICVTLDSLIIASRKLVKGEKP